MEKRKPGRPPKPEGETKPKVLQIRLSEDEKAAYQRAADVAGVPLSVWIRERLDRAAKREARQG